MPRSAVEWVEIVNRLTATQAAAVIAGEVGAPPDSIPHIATAMTAWAMCAKGEDE